MRTSPFGKPHDRKISYRFCLLTDAGSITNCEIHACAGHLAALVYARSLAVYQTVEVWDGSHLVAHIARGEDPIKIKALAPGWLWHFRS